MLRRSIIIPAIGLCLLLLSSLAATPASALPTGYMAISNLVTTTGTGYGPGWVALTYDTSGVPHGPVIGYLFHDGVASAVGNDHIDVFEYDTAGAASVTTPFAGGYAFGHFNGCTWSYLDPAGAELYPEGGHVTSQCTPPSHTSAIFCTNHAADSLCNNGTSIPGEPEAGVWKNLGTSYSNAHTASTGCPAVANIGAAAIYNGSPASVGNPLLFVAAGTPLNVRYVSKDDSWVMAQVDHGVSNPLPYGIRWAFYPRSCITAG